MKLTATMVHGALAATALIAAYVTWQREPAATGESVIVLDASRRDLKNVRYEDPSKTIDIRPMTEGEGVWVTIAQRPPSVDAGTLDGGVEQKVEPMQVKELRGNQFAQDLFKRFAPLRASRALGVVEESKLSELGLKTPLRTLHVSVGSNVEKYDVGASGLGISSPYLRAQDGKVFLLGGGIVSEFDMGQGRLVDRNLHGFTTTDFDAFKVTVGAESREFVLLRGATAAQNKWAPKEAPQTADDFAKNWHDKVWRSFATELLGTNNPPPADKKVEFRIDYFRKGESIGHFELATAASTFYAATEHTAGFVKLTPGGEGLPVEAARVVSKDRK